MTAMVLRYDTATHEAVICSGWGPTTDWIRNIQARPALDVQVGRESFTPQQRFLSEDESFDVCLEFCLRHPARLQVMRRVLGWDLRSETAVRDFVQTHPFVAFRPAPGSTRVLGEAAVGASKTHTFLGERRGRSDTVSIPGDTANSLVYQGLLRVESGTAG